MTAGLGRRLFGLAAVLFGVFSLAFGDLSIWQRGPLGDVSYRLPLVALFSAVEIAGGVAVQFPGTVRAGAAALAALNLVNAVVWMPLFIAKPAVYDYLGNVFEQFSMACGAALIYADASAGNARPTALTRAAYYGFAVCVVSLTLEQAFYLSGTAHFVPKWIPPNQMFWAVLTTVAFGLAAIALLTGYCALLAARLLTAMIAGFGLLVWLPGPIRAPHTFTNWAGNAENLGICAAAWIVAEYLAQRTLKRRNVILTDFDASASIEECRCSGAASRRG